MGILVTPLLITTSVVLVGTVAGFQLAGVAHAVVPPTQVVCAIPEKTINCIITINIITCSSFWGLFAILVIFIMVHIRLVLKNDIVVKNIFKLMRSITRILN